MIRDNDMDIKYDDIRKNEKIRTLVDKANENLQVLGYTDHGPRHVGYVSRIAGEILEKLDYPQERIELAKIAGWTHDVGNLINRKMHAISGAIMLFDELQQIGVNISDVCDICSAVGSHDEEIGQPVSDISAALIIADKVDAYKARVRIEHVDMNDIHDRVNLAIYETDVRVSKEKNQITLELKMKDHATPMEFLQIYLSRMLMCEKSAEFLNCTFKLVINGLVMNKLGGQQI
ncbi:MAG: HD domain-containing protein [Christensenellaceae bacterium]